jgi:hypothetical protein
MSAKNFRNVLIKGDPLTKEAIASAELYPGDLIARDSNGEVAVHAVAGGNAMPAFAREYSEIGNDRADAYSANDQVIYYVCRSGDEVFARVAAGASAITNGDPLESAGDGTLRKADAKINAGATTTYYEDNIVAYAMESVNNSGGAAETWIHVEIA